MKAYVLGAVLSALLTAQPALSAPAKTATPEELLACYGNAKDEVQKGRCLERELATVLAEHKDAVERVTVIAKAWDKPTRKRTRWEAFIRSGQSFDTFVRRECDFVALTTKGSRRVEQNAELACRIGYYRMHTNVLENHYLGGAK